MSPEKKLIADDCGLLRRVHPDQVVPDKNLGGRRLSSGPFRDPNMSVDAECLLRDDGLDWTFSLRQHPQFFLVRLTASTVRAHAQLVDHSPIPNNPYHATVAGRKPQSVCDAFRTSAEWVKKPDGIP
jgi:hypothetical protein